MVMKLKQQPGQKEARYAHLLSGEPVVVEQPGPVSASAPRTGRVEQLEEELAELRAELDQVKQRLENLESLLR